MNESINVISLFFTLISCSPDAAVVSVNNINENVVLVFEDDTKKQITQSGMDCNPLLSPDKEKIVFQRKTVQPTNAKEQCWYWNPQIWVYDIKSEKIELLVDTTGFLPDPKLTLMDLRNLQFSPDGMFLYFTSAAWETSESIHSINIATRVEQFVIDGNSMQIVQEGKYINHLIVTRHKYYPKGGSYDHYWLVNPAGEVLDSIGPNMTSVEEFLKLAETD